MKYDWMLIDLNNLAYRADMVVDLYTPLGKRVSAIYGSLKMLSALQRKFNPSRVFIAGDYGHNKKRVALYPEYKKKKKKAPEDETRFKMFISQLNFMDSFFEALGVHHLKVLHQEADDIIGSLCFRDLTGDSKIIVSSDRDYAQLVDSSTHLYFPMKDLLLTDENFCKSMSVSKKGFLLFKAMVGDGSDNIKGVEGIGPKRAKGLLDKYSLEELFGGFPLPSGYKDKWFDKIQDIENIKIIDRNLSLISLAETVEPDIISGIEKELAKERRFNPKKLIDLLDECAFGSLGLEDFLVFDR